MLDLPTTTIMTNLLARHLCGVVVMHDECCGDMCRSMLLPTKRIVPILLGAPLLRVAELVSN